MTEYGTRADTLHWRINCACNRKCAFCYGPEGKHEVQLERAQPVLEKFIQHGIRTVVLTGGEPLRSRKIGATIRFIKALGAHVVLYTNCDFVDHHEEMLHDHVDTLCVPLDGASEYSHDMVRGENNMRAVMSTLNRFAVGAGGPKVKVGTVVGRNNLHEIRAILYLLDKYKIESWKLYEFLFYPDRGLQKAWKQRQLEVSHREYQSAVNSILGVESRKTKISVSSEDDRASSYFMMNPDLEIIVPLRQEDGIFSDVAICSAEGKTASEIEAMWLEKVDWRSYRKNISASYF